MPVARVPVPPRVGPVRPRPRGVRHAPAPVGREAPAERDLAVVDEGDDGDVDVLAATVADRVVPRVARLVAPRQGPGP